MWQGRDVRGGIGCIGKSVCDKDIHINRRDGFKS